MVADNGLLELYVRLVQGWNDRNAEAMSSCFSTQGIMIGFDGSVAEGPTSIEDHLAPVFADHPTASFVTIVRTAHVTGDMGILRADVGMVPPGHSDTVPEANARQTLVATTADGRWTAELFQNTPAALHWDAAGRASLTRELNAAFDERGALPPSWS